ncbi:Protein required for cell [Apiospora aurea]|uniref:Protein required for cell n=1 Tax=Apiospora aurea TaxID=335848 RepID=A0ABR1Q7Y5_9PEZI
MENKPETKGSLISSIESVGRKAFNPEGDDGTRSEGQRTSSLIAALNALIKPDRVPRWLRLHLMDLLTLMPQRQDGVRATIEFVFASHPSSTVKNSEAAAPQKQGANITLEALKMATGLLAVPPASVEAEKWFSGIAPQLLDLLDGKEGADLVKAAAYIIGYGILGRKQFGAPGSPGWRVFAEPMVAVINPSLSTPRPASKTLVFSAGPDAVVDLQKETVIVQPDELALALRRLKALLNAHPNPGLTGRLLAPLLLPLWTLSSWAEPDEACLEQFVKPAKTLLQIYLKILGSSEKYLLTVSNLLFNGRDLSDGAHWKYESSGKSSVIVKRHRGKTAALVPELNWSILETKSKAFAELLQATASESDTSKLFLQLFEYSFKHQKRGDGITVTVEPDVDEDPTLQIVQSKVLQTMLDKIPDRLIADSKGILELSERILAEFCVSPDNIDSASVALSLVNIVITAPSFQKTEADGKLLASIEASLDKITKDNHPDISQTARNLSLVLRYRDEVDDPSERPTAPTDRQVEDRKTYNLALSYITQADSPPPVRSEGLNLISGLIRNSSSILDIQGVVVLLSSLLAEEEDYINLRVMKMFVQLADKHPKSVVKELLERYVDANEEANVDTRLRFGEAILQVVQRLGDTFSGEIASQVAESLLSIAGRRGHRPKTEEKQAREERLRARQNRAAKTAWGGQVPDLSEDAAAEQERTEEKRKRDEILAQILQGWESKRGSEDVRVRSSALSIFLVGLETNIAGVGATLVEGSVDLCVNILTMEPEMEKAILRRAAIVLILTFVKALADARENRRRLGFGLTDASREHIVQILEYVAQTDNDGLVQQHAQDAVESLRNWQVTAMLPGSQQDAGPAFTRIAGLEVNLPKLEDPGAQRPKPLIEEVE